MKPQLVFWQNIISMHQVAYINVLPEAAHVILVAERAMLEERQTQGWAVPTLHPEIELYVAPDEATIYRLIEDYQNAVHIFSGINAYPMIWRAFRLVTARHGRTIVLAEPYKWAGMQGFLRQCMYRMLFYRYGKRIDALLTTGQRGVRCYRKSGFPEHKLYHWAYFTASSSGEGSALKPHDEQTNFSEIDSKPQAPWLTNAPEEAPEPSSERPRLLFVGTLNEGKNILMLLDTLKRLTAIFSHITVVGDGPLRSAVEHRAADQPWIHYRGTVSNDEVRRLMQAHDLLVLPSKYDGWGAVVNEALQEGLRVLASDCCGSSILLGSSRGEAFDLSAMESVLTKWLRLGRHSAEARRQIQHWASTHISGAVGAAYLMQIVRYINH